MIDIIIPIYHSKKTLPNVLGSLELQIYKEFFITLVQDCDGEDYSDIIEQSSPFLSMVDMVIRSPLGCSPTMKLLLGKL